MFCKFFEDRSHVQKQGEPGDREQFFIDDKKGLTKIDFDSSQFESAFDVLFTAPKDPRVVPPLLAEDYLYLNKEAVAAMIPE